MRLDFLSKKYESVDNWGADYILCHISRINYVYNLLFILTKRGGYCE